MSLCFISLKGGILYAMRLNLVLKLIKGKDLPCNYMYELSSCLYKVLNEGDAAFTDWLHDQGYCKGKKAFKLFTFSNFYIPCFRIEEDRLRILSDTVRLVVSFYPIEAIDAFVIGLFRNRRIEIGDRKSRVAFEVSTIERMPEPEFSPRMMFKTLSPVFIEEQFPDSRHSVHLQPDDPKFAELLHLNLLDKYRAFYGQEPDPSWPVTRLHLLSMPKAKTITLKAGTPQETRMKGYLFQFELEGQPELLHLGYDGGFGRLNSQGFGCVEVVKSVKEQKLRES